MLAYLLAEARYRLSRMIGGLAGVALGVALFTALVAAGDGFVSAARQPLADIGADIVISRPDLVGGAAAQTTRGVRQPFGLAPLTRDEVDQVGEISDISNISGGLLLWDFSGSSYQTLLGVDVETNSDERGSTESADSAAAAGPAQLGDSVSKGRFLAPGDTGVVVVDQHYAAFFSLQPGETVEIGEHSFEVIGIVSTAGANQTAGANFYLTLSDAQSLAGLDDQQVNQLYVRVNEAADVDSVIADAETRLGGVAATTEQSIVSVMGGITKVSERFSAVAALTALVGGLFLTAVTLNAAINLRAREIGVMKATGWRASDVVRLFTTEGLLLGAVGAVIGIVLGWFTILLLAQIPIDSPIVSGVTPDLAEAAPSDSFTIAAKLSWDSVLLATTTAIATGGAVSFLSARRASRLKPADALRT